MKFLFFRVLSFDSSQNDQGTSSLNAMPTMARSWREELGAEFFKMVVRLIVEEKVRDACNTHPV